jgi:L-ascorbate metabolism protein UlaG (beta-lactamase superfamily)
MKIKYLTILILILLLSVPLTGQIFQIDTLQTETSELKITFIGHSSLIFQFGDKVIHIDPVGRYADYTRQPKADIILITHHHGDHLDPLAIQQIHKDDTKIICSKNCAASLQDCHVLQNGDTLTICRIFIETVPAYNIVHKRANGEPYHPKGMGNGYVLTLGGKRIYIAGDTENIPEMANLKQIEIAFLPMNVPFTMSPQMVVDAVALFHPRVLYPYHYGDTDVNDLLELLGDQQECEVRIRAMR